MTDGRNSESPSSLHLRRANLILMRCILKVRVAESSHRHNTFETHDLHINLRRECEITAVVY